MERPVGGSIPAEPRRAENWTPPTPGSVLDRPFRHLRREEEGVYDVHDWSEVRRLYFREHLGKTAIARRLGMSR